MKTSLMVVVPLVAVVLGWYLTNLSQPSLKYQLSSPIEMPQPSGQMSVTQQIEIANVGKAPAQPVQIKIRKKINKPVVIKDSEADKYQMFDTPSGGIEVDYDNLRPNGRIKVIITGDKVTDGDLEIRDQKEMAKQALGSERSGWSRLGDGLVFVVFIYYLLSSVANIAMGIARSNASSDAEEFIKKGKPILLSKATWESCRDLAVSKLDPGRSTRSYEISTWSLYRLLNSDRPARVHPDDWIKILPELSYAIVQKIEETAASAVTYADTAGLQKLVSTPRPSAMSEEVWHKLSYRIGDLYLSVVFSRVFTRHWMSLDEAQKALSLVKPDALDEEQWETFRSRVKRLVACYVVLQLAFESKPFELISKVHLRELPETDADRLRRVAYKLELAQLPDVTSDDGARRFLRAAKPEFISDGDYAQRSRIANTIQELTLREQKLSKREAELSQQEGEVASIKQRVLRQLAIIDAFTSDPGTLETIENYDDVFAPRNLANLKLLGEIHRKATKD